MFDMDMSAGDFLALFYLLKVPVQVIDLKVFLFFHLFVVSLIYLLLISRQSQFVSYSKLKFKFLKC